MTKVYVLTEGIYSDYGIEAIFSTREKAEAALAELARHRGYNVEWMEAEVETYTLDVEYQYVKCVSVKMKRDGTVMGSYIDDVKSDELDYSVTWYGYYNDYILHNRVRGNDYERAVKVTNELRTRLIANGEWPEEQDE